MNKYRLKAFTIMELTVAMLISAIVIAITYTGYSMVSQSYLDYTVKHTEMAVMVRLNELLQKDFVKADAIYKEQDAVHLMINQQTVRYQFDEKSVVRISTIADTFEVAPEEVTLYFENTPLPAEIIADSEENLADELSFCIRFKNEKFPYHYLKQYSSQNLINRNPNAKY